MDEVALELYGNVPSLMIAPDAATTWKLEELCPPGTGEIEVELGFGRGHFLLGRAKTEAGIRFIGLETRRKWVHVASRRAERQDIRNMRVYHADARDVLPRIEDSNVVNTVFINFPDPWWKKRQRKRTLISPTLISQLHRLIMTGGTLFVQTDVPDRADFYLSLLNAYEGFENEHPDSDFIGENPFGTRTHREGKCIEDNIPVYRMLFRKV